MYGTSPEETLLVANAGITQITFVVLNMSRKVVFQLVWKLQIKI